MAKIKLTKGELKRQRDSLGQYLHYLPTLQLKKQQLQIYILQTKQILAEKAILLKKLTADIDEWSGLLADRRVDIKKWIMPQDIIFETFNVAGAKVPRLQEIVFAPLDYDYYSTPFWIDEGILQLRHWVSLLVTMSVIKKQIAILEQELRVTTQRVNLFEKVKIPDCLTNIRKIRICLGDQQANAVGISKVAKKKIESFELTLAGVA